RLGRADTATAPTSRTNPEPRRALYPGGSPGSAFGGGGAVGARYWERNSRSWEGNSMSLMHAVAGRANAAGARQARRRYMGATPETDETGGGSIISLPQHSDAVNSQAPPPSRLPHTAPTAPQRRGPPRSPPPPPPAAPPRTPPPRGAPAPASAGRSPG